MRLSERDKAIIRDINRFRVMDRDSIAELHFSHLKRPANSANAVLKRLVANGHIRRSEAFGAPFLYLTAESNIKKDSAKISHYLAILSVYKEMRKYGDVITFQIEPKYGTKGTVEPDIFCIFRKYDRQNKTPFFIEVQNTVYSQKMMQAKLERYLKLFESGVIAKEPWQPADKPPVFPRVLILSEQRFAIDGQYPFYVIQAQSFGQFVQSLKPTKPKSSGLVADLR
ncbi:hypothetical protein [Thermaerobacillus caldiproteolyticus]|uniref:hypothetical protein n=1 Tax=Thermaerobacillus caldiproteolyticus TaxID=247480 RepID=UPI00188B204F|nr:hypothetical protein [Anoxybacillus caldiproteolyticus]QPA33388.1 hypothetical protein ISX45_19250 [Anoxybacillus caldiproteolyticus]